MDFGQLLFPIYKMIYLAFCLHMIHPKPSENRRNNSQLIFFNETSLVCLWMNFNLKWHEKDPIYFWCKMSLIGCIISLKKTHYRNFKWHFTTIDVIIDSDWHADWAIFMWLLCAVSPDNKFFHGRVLSKFTLPAFHFVD